MALTADELTRRSSSITGSDNYDRKAIRTQSMVAGATIGGLFGLYYGYTKKKNVLVMCAAGAVAGLLVSVLIIPKG